MGDAKLGRQFDPAYQGVAYGDLLDRLSPYRQGGHLLEVGCAVGGFLDAASRRGWQALGIELAEPLARHARESRGLDVRQGTVDTVDIEPGSCDVAVLLDVIEHVIDPKALLARLGVFVRRGDALLLLTPNVSGLGARCLGPAWEAYGPKDHARLFNARTLTSICRAAGFDVRRHWTIDVNPLPFLARLCRSARRLLASKPRAETDGRRALQARDRLISRIYASRLLRLVRRTFNLLLRPTGLGEKLHVLAERR
ncbi:MAG: class I SAM-dependent methyltransferase [Planctomycetota bacterium]